MLKRIWVHVVALGAKLWKDPVWSKVISAGLIAFIVWVWAHINEYSAHDVYDGVLRTLAFRIPVYLPLALVGLYYLAKAVIKSIKTKEKVDPIWGEQIGNYTFKELFDILSARFVPVQTRGMEWGGREAPKENVLIQFYARNMYYSRGVSLDYPRDDGGYLYGVLANVLMEYGLVRKVAEPNEELPNVLDDVYYTSDLGAKFHSNLERLFHKDPDLRLALFNHHLLSEEGNAV